MQYRVGCIVLAVTAVLMTLSLAVASEGDKNYGGPPGTPPALTGDWGGLRTDLAGKGLTFDLSLTQIGQGITKGGKETGWEYGGRGDMVVNADTGKSGLWPGGLFTVELEGNFGQDVNTRTGAMMEVNANETFPAPDPKGLAVPEVMFTQFFGTQFGVSIGKVETGTDANDFASGKGDTQFLNIAFTFNPALFLTVPYSSLGAGLTVLPSGDRTDAVLKLFALDANGDPRTTGFDTVFHGNTTYTGEGRVRTGFFGMTGHQLIGFSYSTKSFTSIEQNLRLVLQDRFIVEKDGSWCVYYNFDQYLYEPEKGSGRGFGIFGRFGASDGNPNPVHYFYSLGIGGKGVAPGRPFDSFGIGYYGIAAGNTRFIGLFTDRSFLGNEQGFEVYYAFGLAPWIRLTPDIQVVRPAQKQMVSEAGIVHVDTAMVLGLRLQLIF